MIRRLFTALALTILAAASCLSQAQVVTYPGLTGLPAATTAYRAAVATTRPANVTAYTANDVVGSAAATWVFPSMCALGGHVEIISSNLRIDITAIPAGMTSFRLYLYNVTPASGLADNAAYDLAVADRVGYQGYLDLGTPIDLGSTLYVQTDNINKQVHCAANDTALYGYLVTNGGFTPAANSEVYNVTLRGMKL